MTSWRKMFEAAMKKNAKEKAGKDRILVTTG